jgi:hypothetical protein
MHDPASAVKSAALVNLITKAKQGKTLTSTDWAELRRLAPDPMPPTPSSWHHATLHDLARALGVSTRTLDSLRTRGAPITADGPHDELAVRLWHAGHTTAKDKPLKPPEGPLAAYADQLAELRTSTTKRGGSTPSDQLKKSQRERVDLLNAEKRKELIRAAQDHAKRVIGRADQELRAALISPGQIALIHGYCQSSQAEAERHLVPLLRSRITTAITSALAHGERQIEER